MQLSSGRIEDILQLSLSPGYLSLQVLLSETTYTCFDKQVAQWATITHLGTSTMFGDTIIDGVQRQVTLNLKQ